MQALKVFVFIIPLLYFFSFNGDDYAIAIIENSSLTLKESSVDMYRCDVDSSFYALIATFYNEQQYAWGFGLQNNSPTIVDAWQIRITHANYQLDPSQLSNQAAFDYVEINNGDGTFDLILTGTSSIPAYSGIPGGNIEWQGVNFGFNSNSDGITIYEGSDVVIPGEPTSVGVVITNRRITYHVNN